MVKHEEKGGVTYPEGFPGGSVKEIRTDVGPGESTNPEAVPKCSVKEFEGTPVEPVPGLHAFTAPKCPGSEIGENKVTTVLEVAPSTFADVPLSGKMYNLEQPTGLASYFGIALSLAPLGLPSDYVHTFLEGHIEWGQEPQGTNKGDYHDVYIIKNVTPGLISSRLIFKGNIGTGGFLTLPSSCTGTRTTDDNHTARCVLRRSIGNQRLLGTSRQRRLQRRIGSHDPSLRADICVESERKPPSRTNPTA